ncbi:secretory lipase [Williamsia muralis]|uniref:Secretory lipase n=2 Tax=Williamsia marianensis TaxID=85044 RepID=A0A495JW71_WILMA|nr:secretory lipase [Williamsia muralis]
MLHTLSTRSGAARRVRFAILALSVSVMTAAAVGAAPSASAAPSSDFYGMPAEYPTTPGSVIRTESMPLLVSIPGVNGPWPGSASRVLYTSRLENGEPTPVSGTFIDSTQPWQGEGERPTVVIGPGTMGQGDQCAPSRAFATGLIAQTDPLSFSANQEALSAARWNALGARVFVTDYVGLGTPGVHTYVNRVEEAHAMIDAARAANALSGTGSRTPIAFWGYSQGGGASAAAAELQPTDAPELNLKGTWAGAPPADLLDVLAKVDGNLIGGVIGFAINGFVARHPALKKPLAERTTPAGQAMLDRLGTECIGDVIFQQPFLRTSSLTRDGKSLLENLDTIPEAAPIFEEQRIGTLAPASPVFVTSGINDDTIPYEQARQLAGEWCEKGADVTFRTNQLPPITPGLVLPNHFGPDLIDGLGTGGAVDYLMDRFANKPVTGCTFN